jgi:hypothetical protein
VGSKKTWKDQECLIHVYFGELETH